MADKKGNTGEENTGELNSGNWNSGNWNSGDWNSGNENSGHRNSGHRNSGHRNSGYGNSANRESGIFCSTQGTVRLFNQPTNLQWDEIDHPSFDEFCLTKWVSDSEMTDDEKVDDPEFNVRGGHLRKYTHKEAWANFWKDTNEENRQKFINLPNFDADVFKEITGIDVRNKEKPVPQEITVDGVTYVRKATHE